MLNTSAHGEISEHIYLRNDTDIDVDEDLIRRALTVLLSEHQKINSEISVLLSNNEFIQELNTQYRGIPYPTDVLSFPGAPFEHAALGDIVISLPYAKKQANLRGCEFMHECVYLAIHGGLHLLGYDDVEEEGQLEMIEEMNRIAVQLDIPEDLSWQTYDLIQD